MNKKNRKIVEDGFRNWMSERKFMKASIWEYENEDTWIINSYFGPVWVKFVPAKDHRDGYTLFCQLMLFPSNHPNGIKPWYQFDHWKQNCHLENHPVGDLVLAALRYHVMKFFSFHKGKPDDAEIADLMLRKSAVSHCYAHKFVDYKDYYEEKLELVEATTEAATA